MNLNETGITIAAVTAVLYRAINTHGVAYLLVGACIANFAARTLGTLAALNTKINAALTFVAFSAIWLSVDNITAVGT